MVPPINPDCHNCKVLADECQSLKSYAWGKWEEKHSFSTVIFLVSLLGGLLAAIVGAITLKLWWALAGLIIMFTGLVISLNIDVHNSYPPGNNQ